MAKLYLYKSRVRTDDQGRPLWVKCESEAGCLQMAKNGFEVKMIEFTGQIPRPKKDFDYLEGTGFGAKKRKKKRYRNKRERKLARKEHRMQHDDGIISITRHGGKKGKQTRKRQRGRRF